MRIEGLIVSGLLLLALAPSLIQGWRNVLVASGCFLTLVFVGFAWMLFHFSETSAEGPAFAGLMILVALTGFILASSCVARLIIGPFTSNLAPPSAVRFRRALVGTGVALVTLTLFGYMELGIQRGFRHHGWLSVGVAWPGREADASVRS